jgi:hypothetical protein
VNNSAASLRDAAITLAAIAGVSDHGRRGRVNLAVSQAVPGVKDVTGMVVDQAPCFARSMSWAKLALLPASKADPKSCLDGLQGDHAADLGPHGALFASCSSGPP